MADNVYGDSRLILRFMLRQAPRDLRQDRERFFEEVIGPGGYVRRVARMKREILDKLNLRNERQVRKRMAIERCKAIKEELMAVCWHPDRVEKLLELGILEEMW